MCLGIVFSNYLVIIKILYYINVYFIVNKVYYSLYFNLILSKIKVSTIKPTSL